MPTSRSSGTTPPKHATAFNRRLWFCIDVCLVLSTVAAALMLARGRMPSHLVAPPPPHLLVPGVRPVIAGLRLQPPNRDIVLRVDTKCPACREMAPWFSRLSKRPGIHLTIVASEPVEDVRSWLKSHDILDNEVLRLNRPSEGGFLLIPTVLALDIQGRVADALVGVSTPDERDRFVARLDSRDGAPVDNTGFAPELSSSEFARRESDSGPHVLLDIRPRTAFLKSGIRNAVNIPQDELEVRGPSEIPRNQAVFLLCGGDDAIQCRVAARTLLADRPGHVTLVWR